MSTTRTALHTTEFISTNQPPMFLWTTEQCQNSYWFPDEKGMTMLYLHPCDQEKKMLQACIFPSYVGCVTMKLLSPLLFCRGILYFFYHTKLSISLTPALIYQTMVPRFH